jgi:hypothetical protein
MASLMPTGYPVTPRPATPSTRHEHPAHERRRVLDHANRAAPAHHAARRRCPAARRGVPRFSAPSSRFAGRITVRPAGVYAGAALMNAADAMRPLGAGRVPGRRYRSRSAPAAARG